jgi:hypothetical protein
VGVWVCVSFYALPHLKYKSLRLEVHQSIKKIDVLGAIHNIPHSLTPFYPHPSLSLSKSIHTTM